MEDQFAASGYSLVELVLAAGLMTTMAGLAVPPILAGLDDFKTASAVRYVSARLQRTRMDAVYRSVNVAMHFTGAGSSYAFGVYADGDGDGIRSSDILAGIDTLIQVGERLSDQFPGVDFGAAPGLPPADPSGTAPGADPVRLGASDMAVFTPLGTSSSGSLYILGPGRNQYVIRLFGETGKVRVLKFNARSGQWEEP